MSVPKAYEHLAKDESGEHKKTQEGALLIRAPSYMQQVSDEVS